MKTILAIAILLCLDVRTVQAGIPANNLPPIAERALSAPESATLFSLEPYTEEPWSKPLRNAPKFHNMDVLGKTTLSAKDAITAGTEFKKAVVHWDGIEAMCFNPRHGLRVTYQHHVFDFLLCFECHQIAVYEDDKDIGDLGAAGSEEVLNGLLKSAHVPLSFVYSDAYLEEQAAEQKKSVDDWQRWSAAVPKSMQAFVPKESGAEPSNFFPNDHSAQLAALAQEYPSKNQQIRALLGWYGTDSGKWSGYPSYEDIPMRILLTYSTADCLAAIEAGPMSDAQWEGAARFFGGWDFHTARPHDLALIPTDLKKKLLAHSLKDADEDKTDRARNAFR